MPPRSQGSDWKSEFLRSATDRQEREAQERAEPTVKGRRGSPRASRVRGADPRHGNRTAASTRTVDARARDATRHADSTVRIVGERNRLVALERWLGARASWRSVRPSMAGSRIACARIDPNSRMPLQRARPFSQGSWRARKLRGRTEEPSESGEFGNQGLHFLLSGRARPDSDACVTASALRRNRFVAGESWMDRDRDRTVGELRPVRHSPVERRRGKAPAPPP